MNVSGAQPVWAGRDSAIGQAGESYMKSMILPAQPDRQRYRLRARDREIGLQGVDE
jgi:hypothetical protein